MDLSKSREWLEKDLQNLVQNQVKESIDLEYKSCGSLQKKDKNRDEVSKDVSAFANSGGGIIVYGISESNHTPVPIDEGYDPSDISKEWLEQVIQGNIRPRINDIHINQVTLSGALSNKVLYVVTIPKGLTAHQAADRCYYKRYNFKSEAMYDHEIRDVMARFVHPRIRPVFELNRQRGEGQNPDKYELHITLRNDGAVSAKHIKLVFYWLKVFSYQCSSIYQPRIHRARTIIASIPTDNVELTAIPQLPAPLFPEDDYRLTEVDSRFAFTFELNEACYGTIASQNPHLVWKIFADDMPPQTGKIHLADIPGFLSEPRFRRYVSC